MHRPVLVREMLDLLAVRRGGTYVDGTVGSGGHAAALLEQIGPAGTLIGIDRDSAAIGRATERLQDYPGRCRLVHGNYADMAAIAASMGVDQVDGILLDLGVSSEQLETPERGFSFMDDGPLDMRMDTSDGETAAELVNRLSQAELGELIRCLGEEPMARRIAAAVVRDRSLSPIAGTGRLAATVAGVAGRRRGRIHPATRTFQALRMAVNDEQKHLRAGLAAGLDLLNVGGRMAVISFHSIEDREVKTFFRRHAGRWESLQSGGRKWIGEKPRVTLVTRKPAGPSEQEIADNPRCRSAKLRVAERTIHGPAGESTVPETEINPMAEEI